MRSYSSDNHQAEGGTGAVGARAHAQQLRLGPGTAKRSEMEMWRLDARTREIGLAGVAQARRALAEAVSRCARGVEAA